MSFQKLLWLIVVVVFFYACKKDLRIAEEKKNIPTSYLLEIPTGMPPMLIPGNNPLTIEGVSLGRKLFYDPILSSDNTLACAGCHRQNYAFTDSILRYSIGINGLPGTRNAPPLFNLGWQQKFFWDGGAATLEDQVIAPITSAVEMHDTLSLVIAKLQKHNLYPAMFKKAFGSDSITTKLLMKAIAQFERTMISANSKYDKFIQGKVPFNQQEQRGLETFNSEKAACNKCHVTGGTFTDYEFRNNGLDSIVKDEGRYRITLDPNDMAKFKTPTLRNIALTAPYMHDGRFKTLKEVMNFYNSDFHISSTIDPVIAKQNRARLNALEIDDLIAFLNTLTDMEFVTNISFAKP